MLAICSRSVSRNKEAAKILRKKFKKIKLNKSNKILSGSILIKFIKDCEAIIIGLEKVDKYSLYQIARISMQMADVSTPKLDSIMDVLQPKIDKIFDKEKYNVAVTGVSIVFLNGTKYLVRNLFTSLFLVIILIAIFMAWMFNSFRMVVISLIPNLIPLLITAAIMGYFNIAIKPSTILVFSIAFGISVDDTIHFLAKYRQELQANNWKIKKSVYGALRETGVSMFYTSIVLFFGFSVFIISSFGGTVALGALVSVTLLFAMLSNLLLLPSLLLSLERNIANKEVLKEPAINIIPQEDNEEVSISDKE